MKLKNQYFLLRHGETIYQEKKKEFIYPPLNQDKKVSLSKKGRKQAQEAGQELKKFGIDLIFSSDFLRTRQTAGIVSKILGGKKIILDKRLRDINLGTFHNKKKKNFYQVFGKYDKRRFNLSPSKGENWLQCQKRMIDFLKEVEKKYQNKKILIVSHGDPLWLLEGAVKNYSQEELIKEKKKNFIETGEVRTLNF